MILPLEQQVCGLELEEKLKDLGCPQSSVFVWAEDGGLFVDEGIGLRMNHNDGLGIAAYSVPELGILLPEYLVTRRNKAKEEWEEPKP